MKVSIDVSLVMWVVALVAIGAGIGSLTSSELDVWYSALNRSSLTPPNAVFPVVWSLLYTMIAISGWLIWRWPHFSRLSAIKVLFAAQLLLNWVWTPLFFYAHLTGIAFIVLVGIALLTAALIGLAYQRVPIVSLLMLPYLVWVVCAGYLNFYIVLYN